MKINCTANDKLMSKSDKALTWYPQLKLLIRNDQFFKVMKIFKS